MAHMVQLMHMSNFKHKFGVRLHILAQVVICCVHKVTKFASWDVIKILWNEFQFDAFFEEFPSIAMVLPFLLPHHPPPCGSIAFQIRMGKFHGRVSPNFGGMKVVFHFCKPNIYNLQISDPVKIPWLSMLESYTFRWSSFKVATNLVKSGLFILSKTSSCSGVKRIVVGYYFSFSWSSWFSQSLCFSESSCSSSLMALDGTFKSRVSSFTLAYKSSLVPSELSNQWIEFYQSSDTMWRTPKLPIDSIWVWSENKRRVRSWGTFLGRNTLGVEGHARASGWDYEEWQEINHSHRPT